MCAVCSWCLPLVEKLDRNADIMRYIWHSDLNVKREQVPTDIFNQKTKYLPNIILFYFQYAWFQLVSTEQCPKVIR